MTQGEFCDHLFSVATGWLGWSPEVALNTPMPQIYLAVEGRVDFAVKTNPFGAGKKEKPAEPKNPKDIMRAMDARFDRINQVKGKRK